MSNVNNYLFAGQLDQFKAKELDPLVKKTEEAFAIMSDLAYPWKTPEAKVTAQARFDQMQARLKALQTFHEQGMTLVKQHEALTDKISKVYDSWWNNISNEGRQEIELMPSQADLLCELMGELYKELRPLNLPDMKPPHGLNL